MTEITLKKAPEETETQFVYRLASARENGLLDMTWDELTTVFNQELGKNQRPSSYRKPFQSAQRYRDEVFDEQDRLKEIREAEQELYKARVKLMDERTELNKALREDARREVFLERLTAAMIDVPPIQVRPCKVTAANDTEIVACLSDLHTGLKEKNHMNVYDDSVLHGRLEQYATELCAIQERHRAKRLVLTLLGDQISGNIHTALIARNSMSTVEQLKLVCTEIAAFIEALLPAFPSIAVYSVSGNHSRLNPKKDDAVPGDNLDSLIPFYLQARFVGQTDRVKIAEFSAYGEYIQAFAVFNWQFVMLHGDLDAPDKAVYNCTQLLGDIPDVVLIGHRHNSGLMTEGKTRVVQSGCMCGTDTYAFNKRLFAPPEQSVLVVSRRRPIECLYNVPLNAENIYEF